MTLHVGKLIERIFGKAREGVEYDFVEVVMECCWGAIPGHHNQGGFVVRWGARGIGFGELSFSIKDGVVHCDNECMSRRFCRGALRRLAGKVCGKTISEVSEISDTSEQASVQLVDCQGAWTKGHKRFKQGGFSLLLKVGQEDHRVSFALKRETLSLVEPVQASLVVAAFDTLARTMTLHDE